MLARVVVCVIDGLLCKQDIRVLKAVEVGGICCYVRVFVGKRGGLMGKTQWVVDREGLASWNRYLSPRLSPLFVGSAAPSQPLPCLD